MKYLFSDDEIDRMGDNQRLTDRQKDIHTLVYRRGLSHQDAANELFISRKTVERELRRIRAAL